MADKPKLDPRPCRQLTSKEVAKALGGLIGGLCQMASFDDVRTAVRWWAESDEAWTAYAMTQPTIDAAAKEYAKKVQGSGDS